MILTIGGPAFEGQRGEVVKSPVYEILTDSKVRIARKTLGNQATEDNCSLLSRLYVCKKYKMIKSSFCNLGQDGAWILHGFSVRCPTYIQAEGSNTECTSSMLPQEFFNQKASRHHGKSADNRS